MINGRLFCVALVLLVALYTCIVAADIYQRVNALPGLLSFHERKTAIGDGGPPALSELATRPNAASGHRHAGNADAHFGSAGHHTGNARHHVAAEDVDNEVRAGGARRNATRPPFFLVASPESSGNRFLVELLLACGCHGRAGHAQPWDASAAIHMGDWPNHFRHATDAPLGVCGAMHRSLPHHHAWPNLVQLSAQIRAAGYEPHVLVSWRMDPVVAASQVMQGHVRTQRAALDNIGRAHRHLVTQLAALVTTDVHFYVVLYDQLGSERYMQWLFHTMLALPLPADHPRWINKNVFHGF